MSIEQSIISAFQLQIRIVAAGDADEHTGARAIELIGRLSRVFERLPGNGQQQPLLRIHRIGLTRRDAKERGIEAVDIAKKAAIAGSDPARFVGIGIVVAFVGPALGRNRTDGIDTFGEQAPEAVSIGGPTGRA